ncbi:MAG: hypothetical protein E7812_08630 [Phenylobacterium sp.]|nr:MAG: hypothetical protein E7812_08630 [Phenylobacterium sp.]
MNTKIAALALLLLAGAAPNALAQDQGDQHQKQPDQTGGERPAHPEARPAEPRTWRGPPAVVHAPAPAAPAPQPHAPPPTPAAPAPRPPGGHDGRPPVVVTPGAEPHRGDRPQGPRDDGHRPVIDNNGAPRPGDQRPGDQHPGDHRPNDGRPRVDGGPPVGGPDWRRGDHGDRGDRGGDWRGDHRPRPTPPPGQHPKWTPGRYPHAYESHHRFRGWIYHRPPHVFVRAWAYGDILPSAWFTPDYLIEDWWDFDLPAPPYGYDWVRVDNDALLVDAYTGRVVQVVRDLFW